MKRLVTLFIIYSNERFLCNDFNFLTEIMKLPNISPGLVEVRKHSLVGLY